MQKFFIFATLCCLPFGLIDLGAQPEQKNEPVFHTEPTPGQKAKNIISSPHSVKHQKFARGLKRTAFHRILSAARFEKGVLKAPAQVIMLPTQLSMWGNSQYGDCVSASEAARKAAYSVYCGLPETFISEANVISWAGKYGYLNGADLTDVMTTMQTNGMVASDGKTYTDGPYSAVTFSDEPTLQAALAVGPVNFGIDADALPSGAGNGPGWYAFGGSPGQFNNEDHCTPSFGYVSGATSAAIAFAAISKAYGVNVPVPANAPAGNVYLWFTWSTVGVVDHAWIMSTAGEAWVQNPTTVGQAPAPAPAPAPGPAPTPGPAPAPGTATTITTSAAIPAGIFELANPGTQAYLAQGQTLQMNTSGVSVSSLQKQIDDNRQLTIRLISSMEKLHSDIEGTRGKK